MSIEDLTSKPYGMYGLLYLPTVSNRGITSTSATAKGYLQAYFCCFIANRLVLLDYIVCGGGTAGLVVAARLTEDPNITVAVLEAGGNGLNDLLIDAPNMFTQLFGKPQYDWNYKTVPQVCL
jgi:hypothetical protein